MAFLIGKYYAGDRFIKPEPYGNVASVQRNIFLNAEKAGIDPALLWRYFPHWEQAGSTVHDYAKNIASTVSLHTWEKGDLSFSDQAGQGYVTGRFDIQNGQDFFLFLLGIRVYYPGGNTSAHMFYQSLNGYVLSIRSRDWTTQLRVQLGSAYNYTYVDDTPPSAGYYNYLIVRRNGEDIELYRDGKLVQTGTRAGALTDSGQTGYVGFDEYNGHIGSVLGGYQALSSYQAAHLSDNPYFLLARNPARTFFIPSGATPATYARPGRTLYGPFYGPFCGPI